MRFGLKRETEGRSEWLDYRGGWSVDETDRMLFDSPAECFRAGDGLPFFTSVEVIDARPATYSKARE
jgi:hypothetical protein